MRKKDFCDLGNEDIVSQLKSELKILVNRRNDYPF